MPVKRIAEILLIVPDADGRAVAISYDFVIVVDNNGICKVVVSRIKVKIISVDISEIIIA